MHAFRKKEFVFKIEKHKVCKEKKHVDKDLGFFFREMITG